MASKARVVQGLLLEVSPLSHRISRAWADPFERRVLALELPCFGYCPPHWEV